MRNTSHGHYLININVECPDLMGEVLASNVEDTAFVIEERVSLLLVELFGAVAVNTVTVIFHPPDARECGAPGPAA